MKAGAFGRQPERRQVQPGGRVLPGMFAASTAAAATAATPANNKPLNPSSSRAATQTTTRRTVPKQRTEPDRQGGNEQGSGRFPAATSSAAASRLDRTLGRRETRSASPESSTQRPTAVDSIARARRLGLNRAPRTRPPHTSESESESDRSSGNERAFPAGNRPAARRHSRSKSRSPPPPRRRQLSSAGGEEYRHGSENNLARELPGPSRSEESESAPTTKPAPRPLPGLLSSLWNRASELVGGNAPAALPPESDQAATSLEPKENGDAAAGAVHSTEREAGGTAVGSDKDQRRGKRPARPVIVPALVAPALTGILPEAQVAQVRSTPSAPTISSVEPITYHRPPTLHSRPTHEEVPRFRSQPTPFDWLDPRDESRVLPYIFVPSATQTAAYEARLRTQAAKAAAQSTASSTASPGRWASSTDAHLPAHPHASAPHVLSRRTGISHAYDASCVCCQRCERIRADFQVHALTGLRSRWSQHQCQTSLRHPYPWQRRDKPRQRPL